MKPLSPQLIDQALNWRYAVKRFDPSQKIPSDQWSVLEQSLVLTPSSYGLQPWKFLVIKTPELREKLRLVSWKQSQVTDASHYVVFLYQKMIQENDVDRMMQRMAEVQQIDVQKLKGYRDVIVGDVVKGQRAHNIASWSQRQTYIAMGFLLKAAALLRIDTCPLEGLETAEYDHILGLQDSQWSTVAAVALGYRHPEDRHQHFKKVRYPHSEIIEYR